MTIAIAIPHVTKVQRTRMYPGRVESLASFKTAASALPNSAAEGHAVAFGLPPTDGFVMSPYTAQVGHWSDLLLEDLAAQLGPGVDREKLKPIIEEVGAEIEALAGQTFGPAQQSQVSINTAFPFVDVPGLMVGSEKTDAKGWAIPDTVNPGRAHVLQLQEPDEVAGAALPIGQALRVAGRLVHQAHLEGRLSRDYLVQWVGHTFPPEPRMELLRSLLDPEQHFHVPLAAAEAGGWWFQITRRLIWVTEGTAEVRLIEPLMQEEGAPPLVGVEPILIAARMTSHPVEWVMPVRIWPSITRRPKGPWRHAAAAIHQHGLPVLTIDDASSLDEVECQLLLLAYWHGYIGNAEPGLAASLATAYPAPVGRIRRATHAPDSASAAALLLEGLLRPGFDPSRGAAATRRYISSKARITIIKQLNAERPGLRAWETLGVSERYYYKLLSRFAARTGHRYDVDEGVLVQIEKYLNRRDRREQSQTAAMDLLQERGFSKEAARKWLRRHPIEQAVAAWPRPRKSALA